MSFQTQIEKGDDLYKPPPFFYLNYSNFNHHLCQQ